MAIIERYRHWYKHEQNANERMLRMLQSVPPINREDKRFQTAVDLAGHLAACRHNWLDRIASGGTNQVDWWPTAVPIESLGPTFECVERQWATFLDRLDDDGLTSPFSFGSKERGQFEWPIEDLVFQLVGHTYYHRGQIAQSVRDLGGEYLDTDYLYWQHNLG